MERYYSAMTEEIPTNVPQARGKPIQITAFVDADHAEDDNIRQSRTGVLIYIKRSPILWYSKNQIALRHQLLGQKVLHLRHRMK
jgi:hypothetical protein